MAKSTRNSGKAWTSGDKQQLIKLAGGNTPTRVMGLKLGRSESAVRSQAATRQPEANESGSLRIERQKVMEWTTDHSVLTAKAFIAVGIVLILGMALWLEFRDLSGGSPESPFSIGFQPAP